MFIPRDSRLVIETLFYIQGRQFILRQENDILAPHPIQGWWWWERRTEEKRTTQGWGEKGGRGGEVGGGF